MARFLSVTAALALLGGAAVSASCITETTAASVSPRGVRTSGFIVNGSVDATWPRVRSAVASMTGEPLQNNGVPHSIRTSIGGAPTTVLVEARDARSTAVHVNSTNSTIAERIQASLSR